MPPLTREALKQKVHSSTLASRGSVEQKIITLLDLCVSSLRRGHANLLCIVPILTDDPQRESIYKSSLAVDFLLLSTSSRPPPPGKPFCVKTVLGSPKAPWQAEHSPGDAICNSGEGKTASGSEGSAIQTLGFSVWRPPWEAQKRPGQQNTALGTLSVILKRPTPPWGARGSAIQTPGFFWVKTAQGSPKAPPQARSRPGDAICNLC